MLSWVGLSSKDFVKEYEITEAKRKIVNLESLLAILNHLAGMVPDEWRDNPQKYRDRIREIKKNVERKANEEIDFTSLVAELLCLGVDYKELLDTSLKMMPDEYDTLVAAMREARRECLERRESLL
jgi:hypothetical protein